MAPAQQASPLHKAALQAFGRDPRPPSLPVPTNTSPLLSGTCEHGRGWLPTPRGQSRGSQSVPAPLGAQGLRLRAQSPTPPLTPGCRWAAPWPAASLSWSFLGTTLLLNPENPVPCPGPLGWSRVAVTSRRPQKLRAGPFSLVGTPLAFWGDRGGLGSFLPSKEMETRPLGGARWAADPSLRPLQVAHPLSCLAPAWGASPGGLSACTGSCPAARFPH